MKRQDMVFYKSLGQKKAIAMCLQWLGRFIPVKHRYVLTRNNRLRMRYIAPSFAAFAICLIMIVTGLFIRPHIAIDTTPSLMVNGSPYDYENDIGSVKNITAPHKEGNIDNAKMIKASLTQKTPPQPKEKTLKIGKGDTLAGVLQDAGVGASEAYKAVLAMEEHFDPRKIRPGQKIQVRFDPADKGYLFAAMEIGIDAIKSVSLERTENNNFKAKLLEKEVTGKLYANKANIETSLYGSSLKVGIPAPVIAQAIHIFSWDVDFQRDIRKGDVLDVMYEQFETSDGTKVKGGDVIYARLDVNGHDIPVYRFETDNGDVDYFTASGSSIRKALMKTPVDGARLSAGYGMRKHPVLGYNKMHKGIDFAASRGTPIYAAGDGKIEKAGPWSSYGNYIRIRHNASLKTAYAHMKGFAKGIKVGERVKQGQVIGYVGTTGRSTGPHLHYEVLQNGKQTNPNKIKMPQGATLKGAQLASFKNHVKKLDRQYVTLMKGATLASTQKSKISTMR